MKNFLFGALTVALTSVFLTAPVSAAEMLMKHAAKGVSCEACHKTKTPSRAAKASVCESCHTYADVAKKTAKVVPNPHESHAGEVRCTLCHKEHKASENYCLQCHATGDKFKFKVP